MMTKRHFLLGSVAALGAGMAARLGAGTPSMAAPAPSGGFDVVKTDAEWRRTLTAEQYRVLRDHGTERAGTSPLDHEKRSGLFNCAGCAQPVFSSEAKYDSGTGWPSFFKPLPQAVGTSEDRSWFAVRTEVHCARCGGHLGHVFDDGPEPTGLRYCMNGVALDFVPA
ncbi:peptide-methionine (R)-S-oxide reductase MsrB [Arenibaculum sp.]|jgi:peptide-methionine (R)-S-oxide reductase|uniref:peptide-methionine (R)-S-oxide reductase MsrB n=1 Tax=Arenibaculum sp. TaxID=2865862 RepID=UPI002E0DCBE5|nr:peptide-methionine (R)-S-oxide reductase MsrB [Arenibaculum sp.]